MSGVAIRGVSKSFGPVPVLKNVSLDIGDGEFLTLLGPSGCGKSTLLRIIAGLEGHDAGAIAMGDRVVDGLRPKERDVAMVFQSYALYPHMTVRQNIAVPLRMRRLNAWQRLPIVGGLLPGAGAAKAGIARDVASVAKAMDIDQLLERKPGALSGGQRQRVALGRAMVRQPAVFLMDEPLSNLDAKLRVQMRAEIKELHSRLGVTFVYVTHDQAEAMTMSDRVAVMLEGQLLQVARPDRIYADPDDLRVAEFIGSLKMNILAAGVVEPGYVEVAGARLPVRDAVRLTAGTRVKIGIRPEAVQLFDHAAGSAVTGSVRMVENLGSDLMVHVDVPEATQPVIARLLTEHAPRVAPGQRVHLTMSPDRVLVFAEDGARVRTDGGSGKP